MTIITPINDVVQYVQIEGSYKGRTKYMINILGRRDTWNGTNDLIQDVGEYLGTDAADAIFNDPSAGVIMELVSSSTSDTSAGTGARTVKVAYLDTSNNIQWTNVTMNGTTAVDLIDAST